MGILTEAHREHFDECGYMIADSTVKCNFLI